MRRVRIVLGVLLTSVGVMAVASGLGLVTDRSGANLGMTVDALAGRPFPDYLLPGLVLLLVHGLAGATAGIAVLAGWRRSGEAGMGLGVLMLGWMVVQIGVLGLAHWLQPLFVLIGGVEFGLGMALWSGRKAAKPPDDL